MEDTDLPMASSELELTRQVENLMAMDSLSMVKEILVTTIAFEVSKTKSPKARLNATGLAALLKLFMSMEGIEKATERDIDINLPEDAEKAIDEIIAKRSKSDGLKSLQANDLAALVERKKDLKQLAQIKELLEAAEAKDKIDRVRSEFAVKTREEVEGENDAI